MTTTSRFEVKISFFLLLFGGVLLPLSSSGSSPPPSQERQDQIKHIESELSREKEKYEAFNSKEHDLLDRLSELEKEVADKKKAVRELNIKIEQAGEDMANLEKGLPELERSLQAVEGRLESRLVTLYKYARKAYMHALANAEDLDQFRRRVKYVWAVMQEDQRTLGELAQEARRYREEISQVKKRMAQAEAIKHEEGLRVAAFRQDLEEKVILLMKVHKEKEFYETAVKELELAAGDLKQTLSDIEDVRRDSIPENSHFADFKGKLPLPLDGRPVRGGQFLKTADLNLHKGIFIKGPSDHDVKAVFPGRVDFSGRLKGYGEMVVINHGSRFFTISALLSKRAKKKGDRVESGDVIGKAATEGSSKEPTVYFEIRKGSQNLDPMKWLKVP
jgi:septal ring factor EnvC (AmiA/AmiB activator)